MLPDEYPDTKYDPPPDAAYRKEYEKGWRASHPGHADGALERADARNAPDSFYDAYHDRASGRPKWHSWHCQQAGGCWEHKWV